MKNIIDTSPKVTLEITRDISIEVLDKNLKSKYTQFLRDGGWKCFLVHHPRELPFVMALVLEKMNKNDTNLETFLRIISSGTTESMWQKASFQRILDKMESKRVLSS